MEADERQLFKNETQKESKRTANKIKMIDLLPQMLASCLMYSLVIQAGINMSFASVLISQLGDENGMDIDTQTASIIGSIWSISLPFGAITSGFLMDKFGRRRVGLFLCVPFFVAWILVSLGQSMREIYIARILAGICCGLTAVSVVYTSEISYKTYRSSLLCMNSVWVSFGIFLTYLLNYFHLNWRLIGWIYAFVSILSMILIFFVPESPHWILFVNREKTEEQKTIQLRKCLSWFYHNPKIASLQCDELLQTYEEQKDARGTNHNEQQHWITGIKYPQVYKPLLILVVLFLLQQLSGGYILIFYTINIFRNLGSDFLTSVDENLASLLLGIIRLVMALIAAILSQKCNRKTLLYISTLGMTLFAYLAAIKMYNSDHHSHSFFSKNSSISGEAIDEASSMGNYFLLTCVLAYILFASLGILIIPWTCIAELYSIKYKANFGGLTVSIAYVLMSIVLKIFPFMIDLLDIYAIFLMFGTSSLLCCIFVYYFLPETHRKTFSEIEKHFTGESDLKL